MNKEYFQVHPIFYALTNFKMKKIFLFLNIIICMNSFAQQKAADQKKRLAQYIGNWASTDNLTDTKVSLHPGITMMVTPKMDSNSLQIEVFQKKDAAYQLILVELISYDATTDQIVAAGQNNAGQCFVGKGFFDKNNTWIMEDHDYNGKLTQTVTFNFTGSNTVALKGDVPGTNGWQVKYIKVNNKIRK
jgi:hypothetical protein